MGPLLVAKLAPGPPLMVLPLAAAVAPAVAAAAAAAAAAATAAAAAAAVAAAAHFSPVPEQASAPTCRVLSPQKSHYFFAFRNLTVPSTASWLDLCHQSAGFWCLTMNLRLLM